LSKITLKPNASGTGVFSLEAPNSNSDRTLNLPDEAGSVATIEGIESRENNFIQMPQYNGNPFSSKVPLSVPPLTAQDVPSNDDTLTFIRGDRISVSHPNFETIFDLSGNPFELVLCTIMGPQIQMELTVDGELLFDPSVVNSSVVGRGKTRANTTDSEYSVVSLPYIRAESSMKLRVRPTFSTFTFGWIVAIRDFS